MARPSNFRSTVLPGAPTGRPRSSFPTESMAIQARRAAPRFWASAATWPLMVSTAGWMRLPFTTTRSLPNKSCPTTPAKRSSIMRPSEIKSHLPGRLATFLARPMSPALTIPLAGPVPRYQVPLTNNQFFYVLQRAAITGRADLELWTGAGRRPGRKERPSAFPHVSTISFLALP